MEPIWLIFGMVSGAAGAWWLARARWSERLAYEQRLGAEQLAHAERVNDELDEKLRALSHDALKSNSESFLQLAAQSFAPIHERLESFDTHLRSLEQARVGAYGQLSEQVRGLAQTQEHLRAETGKLVSALHKPGVRGRWGEMTLRRVVELAGMVDHCDFTEQATVQGAEGAVRPDMVVHLPGHGSLPIDAKVPLDSYLAAAEATDERTRQECLAAHARSLKEHMVALGRKSYWEQFPVAPDFVVMFVPGDSFVAAAVDQRPELFEEGFAQRVVVATPSTLMALLRVVAFGWRQERLAESAQEVSALGADLYSRLSTMATRFSKLGRSIKTVVTAFNDTVANVEGRVLPAARKFEGLGVAAGEIEHVDQVEVFPRELTAAEFVDPPDPRVVELPGRGAATG